MRDFLGVTVIATGILAGLYIGGWVMLVGGLAECVTEVRAEVFDKWAFSVGVLNIVLSGAVGGVFALFGCFVGTSIMKDK